MAKERLMTKDFITVAVINFLMYMIFYLLMVIIAGYAIEQFGASTGMAGLVSGIFIIGILFGRLGAGRIIETVGSKNILIAGSISCIITSLLYFAAVNIFLMTIIRFLHGAAYGIASTATGTIVAQILPDSRRGEGIGYYSLSQIIAAAVGPFIGIFLSRHTGFYTIFIISAVIAAISLVIALLIKKPVSPSAGYDSGSKAGFGFSLSDFLEYKAIPISIVVMLVGFAYSVVLSFLSLYTRSIQLSESAGYFFLVYAATVLISRPFSGRLLDTRGSNVVVYPCLLLYAIGMLLLSQAGHGLVILLAGVVIGFGYGNFLSVGQAISIRDIPSHRLGLATATYYIFLDLGFGIGPYLFGNLIPLVGYRGLYAIMAGIIFLTIGLYYVLHREKA